MQRTRRLLRASQSSAARVLTAQVGAGAGAEDPGEGCRPWGGVLSHLCRPRPPGTQLITVHSLDAGELTPLSR